MTISLLTDKPLLMTVFFMHSCNPARYNRYYININ